MAIEKLILILIGIQESIRVLGDIAALLQISAGVTDEQLANAKAKAKAGHNGVQNTP